MLLAWLSVWLTRDAMGRAQYLVHLVEPIQFLPAAPIPAQIAVDVDLDLSMTLGLMS